ncbi:UNVERIFIED_CONTAM: Retrovirus-related Pol polyprotein from transposon RE1 [Sesamum radiatum]|uniref:Retrovirus-related Pol polyprotein from transposon RE1 n=1 Tax=Sesamum radiatum TaxID=300843 RepID=A0AAW2TY11_SESRA
MTVARFLCKIRYRIEKAFSMIFAVEKQREVHSDLGGNLNQVACQLTLKSKKEDESFLQKKKPFVDKKNVVCTHCRKTGHSHETCFQLHDIPEWYKSLNDRKKKGKNFVAIVEGKIDSQMAEPRQNVTGVMAELLKFMQNNSKPVDPISNFAHYAHLDADFAESQSAVNPHPLLLVSIDTDTLFVPSPSLKYILNTANPLNVTSPRLDTCTTASPPIIRRSSRQKTKLAWLDDFVSISSDHTLLHPYNTTYLAFVASLSILQEPKTFSEAINHEEWRQAMQSEIDALEQNNMWKVVSLPEGKRPIGCKWVFKTKLRADGSVERYKARLVAKGFNKVAGVDYTDNFSPVAKPVTLSLFLAIAAANNWPLHQSDINNTFLHGYLEEDLYMASRQWNVELTQQLTAFGFTQSAYDHCLFTKPTDLRLMTFLVYVDDILITALSLIAIQTTKDYLHTLFTIKDIGEARYFLGLEIARNSDGIYVAQTKYVMDILADTGLKEGKATTTPLPLGLKLSTECGVSLQNPDSFRCLIGRLLYLGFTRPDIAYSVQQLSQFLNRPCVEHWKAALHIVRYLKGCPSKGLFFPSQSNPKLQAFCDADWASFLDSRRSLMGFCILLGDAIISWKTKKQRQCLGQLLRPNTAAWRQLCVNFVGSLTLYQILVLLKNLPIKLFCDNQAALHIMANPVFHERTKHIELGCHIVRDAYKKGFINPSHVRSSLQIADLFIKVHSLKLFASLLSKLGLVSMVPSPTCGGGC